MLDLTVVKRAGKYGDPTIWRDDRSQEVESIQCLVESFQAGLWGGRVRGRDLIATYEHACAARNHAVVAIAHADVAAIRHRLDAVTQQWAGVPINGGLTLNL